MLQYKNRKHPFCHLGDSCCSGGFSIGKNKKFVEDHPMNIPTKFEFFIFSDRKSTTTTRVAKVAKRVFSVFVLEHLFFNQY
jgi:hypothetical protein